VNYAKFSLDRKLLLEIPKDVTLEQISSFLTHALQKLDSIIKTELQDMIDRKEIIYTTTISFPPQRDIIQELDHHHYLGED